MQSETLTQVDQQAKTNQLGEQQRSQLQIRLLKGPLYRAKHRDLWQMLEREQHGVRDYFRQIGLSLKLDDAEGYAFLQQMEMESEDGEAELPRLITRRSLTFDQTLLLVQLRKRLAEHDASESSPRLLVSRSEIHQWLKPFFTQDNNEVKQRKKFDALINKIKEMGFLTALPNHEDDFEVQRILKAMVTAEQIAVFYQSISPESLPEAEELSQKTKQSQPEAN